MTEKELRKLHDLSTENRYLLKEECGCFFCLNIIKTSDIKRWIDNDQTALCPKCGIDSIIDKTDIDILTQMYDMWFGSVLPRKQ